MTRSVLYIIGPVIAWSLHFIAIYALISAACAPRGLIEIDVMRAAAGLITLALSVGVLAWLVTAGRHVRRAADTENDATLATAAWWCALISLLAIFANLWPIAWLTACTG